MKKRIIALMLVLVLVLGALAACGNKQEQPASNEGQSEQPGKDNAPEDTPKGNLRKTTTSKEENAIRTGLNSDLHTLDIHHSALANEDTIARLMMDSLMIMVEGHKWEPWICTKMEPNEDGSAVECEIRDDVYFASGDKMTMEDILYSYERCKISNTLSTLYQVSQIEAVDDTHFIVHFPVPGYNFTALQDYLCILPVYNKSFCEQFIDDPTGDLLFNVDGSGPYKLESPLSAGIHDVTLVKNENFWNKGNYGFLDKIYFKYLTGDAEIAFEAGDIDRVGYRLEDLEKAQSFDNVSIERQFSGFTYIFVLNCTENSPFHDIRVREAIQYGFDRETVGLTACGNNGAVAWTIFTPECANWADVVPHRTLDAEKCKALMTEAGYSESNPCKITCFSQSSQNWLAALEILKEDLDKLYFEVTIEEGQETTRYYTGAFDLAIIGFNLSNTFSAYSLLLVKSTGLNLSMYDEPDAQLVAGEVMQASTPEQAKQAMLDFDSLMCYIPLSYASAYYVFDADLDMGPFVNNYDLARAKWKN